MKHRVPCLLFAFGLLGVVLYPRLVPHLPLSLQTDFLTGLVQGAFIGLELVGAALLIRLRRCGSCCRPAE
jgi:hypothetical protein